MSQGGRPVGRFNCKCKTDYKPGSMEKKPQEVLTFTRPGLNQFLWLLSYPDSIAALELLIRGEIRYTFAAIMSA